MKENYTIMQVYKEKHGIKCDKCGRMINNVVVLYDKAKGERLYLGTTCALKVLSLHKSYKKTVREYVDGYKSVLKYCNLQKENDIDNEIINNYKISLLNTSKQSNKLSNKREILLRNSICDVDNKLELILETTRELQDMNRRGLIRLENLSSLEKRRERFKNRFKEYIDESLGTWNYKIDEKDDILKRVEKINKIFDEK